MREVVVFEKERSQVLDNESVMLVHSENINNGTNGLCHMVDGTTYASEPAPESSLFAVFTTRNGQCLLLGFIPPVYRRTRIFLTDETIRCCVLEEEDCPDYVRFPMEKFVVIERPEAWQALEEYAALWNTACPKCSRYTDTAYFNTWDYYMSSVCSQDVEDVLADLETRDFRHVSYMVIDDGWEISRGDWEANSKFQGDMRLIVRKIRDAGRIPGLWLAPFFVDEETAEYEWAGSVAVDASGNKVKVGPFGIADITNPDVMGRWIKRFHNLYEMGFRLFKLDFLHYLATSGAIYQNNKSPRIWLIREFLRSIKEALPDDAILLACGCPPEAAAYIADICRIGGDIATFNSTVKIAAQCMSVRYWMHGRLFVSDPDFIMARTEESFSGRELNPFIHKEMGEQIADEAGSRSGIPWSGLGEARIWCALVAMSGGIQTYADRPAYLSEEAVELLRTAWVHRCNSAAKPLDVMEADIPSLWYRAGDRPALLVINWTDMPLDIDISCDIHGVHEDWSRYIPVWKNNASCTSSLSGVECHIPPLDCLWLEKEGAD